MAEPNNLTAGPMLHRLAVPLQRLVRSRPHRTLAAFGIIYVLVGWIYLGTVSILRTSPTARMAYKAHLEVMPLAAWSWCFIVCGAAAAAVSLTTRWTWIGFGLLAFFSAWWGAEFFASWASTGYSRIGAQGAMWALLVLVLTDYARADEPPALQDGP